MIYTSRVSNNITSVFDVVDSTVVKQYYPSAPQWFTTKVLPQLHLNRDIHCINKNDTLLGFMILKKNPLKSSKICTLYVNPLVRDMHIASMLLCNLFYQNNEAYHITVNENRQQELHGVLTKFGFSIADKLVGQYLSEQTEYIYAKDGSTDTCLS